MEKYGPVAWCQVSGIFSDLIFPHCFLFLSHDKSHTLTLFCFLLSFLPPMNLYLSLSIQWELKAPYFILLSSISSSIQPWEWSCLKKGEDAGCLSHPSLVSFQLGRKERGNWPGADFLISGEPHEVFLLLPNTDQATPLSFWMLWLGAFLTCDAQLGQAKLSVSLAMPSAWLHLIWCLARHCPVPCPKWALTGCCPLFCLAWGLAEDVVCLALHEAWLHWALLPTIPCVGLGWALPFPCLRWDLTKSGSHHHWLTLYGRHSTRCFLHFT